jgi:hypothetical protein
MTEHWVWHRWQLIKVDEQRGEVVLDAIELSRTDRDRVEGPLTVVFRDRLVPDTDGETVGEMLQRWVVREEGLCDVFHRQDEPLTMFAMFQGTDSVLASIPEAG